jgi:hypothetical protein
MSSIILTQDHEGKKKGDTISVPFIQGKDLVAQGIGTYPAQLQAVPPKPAAVAADPELARLKKLNEEQAKKIDALQKQVDELLDAPPSKEHHKDKK